MDSESKGTVAVKFGLLRGLLHAISGFLLSGVERVMERTAVDLTSKGLIELLKTEGVFVAAIAFLHQQVAGLLQISEQVPIYFGYIKGLLALLGLHG